MIHHNLEIQNPKLAAEWDDERNYPLRPSDVTAGANRKVWWICAKGHSWQALISSRNRGRNCPYCTGRAVLAGFNDLATLQPELAKQWDYEANQSLTPKQVTVYSHRRVWWMCENGHRWRASIANRSNGTGCPYCKNKLVVVGENDLKTLRPDLSMQWDEMKNAPLSSEQVTLGSNRKVWWICNRGHRFEATVVSRVQGRGCPYCAGKRPIVGETDFASVHPELLPEWDYKRNGSLLPQNITAASHKRIWWRCSKGHSWKAPAYQRHAGNNCPICARLKDRHTVLPGKNDLATTHPSIAAQWDFDQNNGVTPQQVLPGSNRKFWWKCAHGHRWQASVLSRTNGSRCPKCSGKTHTQTRFVT